MNRGFAGVGAESARKLVSGLRRGLTAMSEEDAYDCLRGSTGLSGLRLGIASIRQGDAKSELCKRARVNELDNYEAKFMQDNTVGKRGSFFVPLTALGSCAQVPG